MIELAIVQVINNVEDEQTFSNLTFMKSKLWNWLVKHLDMGENTLWGGTFGTFMTSMWNIFLQNILHLILGFTFGVWVWYFDFHKVNDI